MEILSIPVLPNTLSPQQSISQSNNNSSNSHNSSHGEIQLDCEWLAIVRKTHCLLEVSRNIVKLPTTIQKVTSEVSGTYLLELLYLLRYLSGGVLCCIF